MKQIKSKPPRRIITSEEARTLSRVIESIREGYLNRNRKVEKDED